MTGAPSARRYPHHARALHGPLGPAVWAHSGLECPAADRTDRLARGRTIALSPVRNEVATFAGKMLGQCGIGRYQKHFRKQSQVGHDERVGDKVKNLFRHNFHRLRFSMFLECERTFGN